MAPIEFDTAQAPEPGGVGSSGRFVNDRDRWAWIAVGVCISLLVAIVIGGRDSGGKDEPVVATPPNSVVVSIYGRGAAVTVRISALAVAPRADHTLFTMTGSGGAPDRRYDLEVGRCPSTAPMFSVGTRARMNGTLAGTLETPGFSRDAVLWMTVVDQNGEGQGGAEGRLGDRLFSPIAPGGEPCQGGAGRTSVTTLDRPVHFTDRRATVRPPTDIGVDVVSPADVISKIRPLGVAAPELILGRYDDAQTGLTLDPAWIVIDRGVVTSDLEADGVTQAFHSTNLVRVVNAVTGRVVFTFPAPGEPVIMSQ